MALRPRPQRLNGAAVSDAVLAAQATVGDLGAFEALMRRHERRVHYLLQRFTRDPALAEELCQETFLQAWRKLASFEGRGAFSAWLTRLAYRLFLQHRRRNALAAASDSLEDPGVLAAAEAAGGRTSDPHLEPDLERLLAVVSPDEQRVLTLAYGEGMSAAEIGALLGVAPGTVKSQIHRAKEKIRRHFAIEVAS